MKLEYITKSEFDFIKDNIDNWLQSKLIHDPDTIFQFSSNLTSEDIKYIYQHSDNFIINKNRVVDIDNFETIDRNEGKEENGTNENGTNENGTNENGKYELIMRAGRKYYNKLQRYPIQNMGIINIINSKLDKYIVTNNIMFFMNTIMFIYILNK